jgi:hypothetical protein
MRGNVSTQQIEVEGIRQPVKTVFRGSMAESIASGATIVLSLIAPSGVMRDALLAIAVVTAGVAFLVEGGSLPMRFSRARLDKADFGIGMTSELFAGMSGVVLGILSLMNLSPMLLLPVAVIVFGGALMLSDITMRLNDIELDGMPVAERFKNIAHEITTAAVGVEFLLGLSAVILGSWDLKDITRSY